MARARKVGGGSSNGRHGPAALGFEATLWQAADKLRNNMDAAEYKHVVLGLIFLKIHLGCVRGAARAARPMDGGRAE